MAKRKIGKKLRFEILKRDGFRCIYCGSSPMRGFLHVDHVVPVVDGGTDEPHNLATSCSDCNLGKGPVPLDQSEIEPEPKELRDPHAIRERAEQIREYLAAQKELESARAEAVQSLEDLWEVLFAHHKYNGLIESECAFLRRLLERFDWEDVAWAMRRASEQCTIPSRAWKYFCAISHRWLREGVTR